MILLITVQLVLACPTENLYAVGLNAYVIQVEEQVLSLEMNVEKGRLSVQPVVEQWEEILHSCNKEKALLAFEYFIGQTEELYNLGEEFHSIPWWRWYQKYLLRQRIREGERNVALSYANFLRILQRETGIAVKWDKEAHFLAQGVISTARGSDLVADYIVQMWEK